MRSTTLAALLLVLATTANADRSIEKHERFEGTRLFHQIDPSYAGNCTIIQFDICGGWIWQWEGFRDGDEIGVVFDLPSLCSKEPGGNCTNDAVWWYWRNALPGRGFTVQYDLYAVDGSGCKTGSSLGSQIQDPVAGWNMVPGLGATSADEALVIAHFNGILPYAVSDNNVRNANEIPPCPIGPASSFQFSHEGVEDCPPIGFDDDLGPVDLMVKAAFTCDPASDAAPDSWGGVKSLFR